MRERLVGSLRAVNDPDVDRRWLEAAGRFDDWFNDLEFLLSEGPAAAIGVVLVDEREAEAVAAFHEQLDAIYSDLGDVGYLAYRSDPRWAGIRDAAQEALVVLSRLGGPAE